MAAKPKAKDDDLKSEEKCPISFGLKCPPRSEEHLKIALQQAMALELSTLPLYISALYSFKPENRGCAAYAVILSVVMQEMTHMAIVNNVMVSIWGNKDPCIGASYNIPYGPNLALPGGVRPDLKGKLVLNRCTLEQIYDVFIKIEEPSDHIEVSGKPDVFMPSGQSDQATVEFLTKPRDKTIGEFYNSIIWSLVDLNLMQRKITFSNDKDHVQLDAPQVCSLSTAIHAISVIKSEGEGSLIWACPLIVKPTDGEKDKSGKLDKSHFVKFVEVLVGREVDSMVAKWRGEYVDYTFTYGKPIRWGLNDLYTADNWKKPAATADFDAVYKELVETVTANMKNPPAKGWVNTDYMKQLKGCFDTCMGKGTFPTFQTPFDPPPSFPADYEKQ